MRYLLSMMVFFSMGDSAMGQEAIFKHYKVYNFIDFSKDGISDYDYEKLSTNAQKEVIFLSRERFFTYEQLNIDKRDQKKLKII